MPSRLSVLKLCCFSSLQLVLACSGLWFLLDSSIIIMDWTLVWWWFYTPLPIRMLLLWSFISARLCAFEFWVSAIQHSPYLSTTCATGPVSMQTTVRWHLYRWAVCMCDCQVYMWSATGSETGTLDPWSDLPPDRSGQWFWFTTKMLLVRRKEKTKTNKGRYAFLRCL